MQIKVQFSEDGLFGSSSTDGIDVAASEQKFADQLCAALKAAYPTAGITVEAGNDDYHQVDGRRDTDEAEAVGEIVHDTWEAWAWVVTDYRALAIDALSVVSTDRPIPVADTTVLHLNADGTYTVTDNGEQVDGLDRENAIRVIVENLTAEPTHLAY